MQILHEISSGSLCVCVFFLFEVDLSRSYTKLPTNKYKEKTVLIKRAGKPLIQRILSSSGSVLSTPFDETSCNLLLDEDLIADDDSDDEDDAFEDKEGDEGTWEEEEDLLAQLAETSGSVVPKKMMRRRVSGLDNNNSM